MWKRHERVHRKVVVEGFCVCRHGRTRNLFDPKRKDYKTLEMSGVQREGEVLRASMTEGHEGRWRKVEGNEVGWVQ